MVNKLLFLLSLICNSILCHAQKDNKIYFDSLDNNVLNPSEAYYYHYEPDASTKEVEMKYYYLDGTLYAEGKAVLERSSDFQYWRQAGEWVYYYPNGNKKEIFECLFYFRNYSHRWYENGSKEFSSHLTYSHRFRSRYYKVKSWYSSGKIKYVGLQRLCTYNNEYGYLRYYREDGTCWQKRCYPEGNLPGISEYIDVNGDKKYYIILNEAFFWYDTTNAEIVIRDTITKLVLAPAKDGYNELIYDLDTFRLTIKNGQLEGAYYHSSGSENRSVSKGFCHRNYKTGLWVKRSKMTRGDFINHYEHYKRNYRCGNIKVLLNDSVLLMKGRCRYNKEVGRWLVLDGAMSDPHVMGDKDSLYFREEKFRYGTESRYYQNVYVAKRSDFSIKYLWITSRKKIFTKNTITIEYYPNHQVKRRSVYNKKEDCAIEKSYTFSGKLIEKKVISYKREPLL